MTAWARRWAESEHIDTYGGLGRPDDPESPADMGLYKASRPSRLYPSHLQPLYRTAGEAQARISPPLCRQREDYDPYHGYRVGEAAIPGPRFIATPTLAASPPETHRKCTECNGLLPHSTSDTTHRCHRNARILPDAERYWCAFCDTYVPALHQQRHHAQACRRSLPTRWVGVPTQRQRSAAVGNPPPHPHPTTPPGPISVPRPTRLPRPDRPPTGSQASAPTPSGERFAADRHRPQSEPPMDRSRPALTTQAPILSLASHLNLPRRRRVLRERRRPSACGLRMMTTPSHAKDVANMATCGDPFPASMPTTDNV